MLKTLARESGKNCFTNSPEASGYTHLLYEIHTPLNKGPGQEGVNRTLQTGYSIVHIWTLLKYRNPPTAGQYHPSDHPPPPYDRIAISLHQLLSSFPLNLEKDPAFLPGTIRSPTAVPFNHS